MVHMKLRVVFNLIVLIVVSGVCGVDPARAHGPRPRHALPPEPDEDSTLRAPPSWSLSLGGYGELLFAWLDHGQNQNRPGGAQRDSRLVFDTTRFVLELEGTLPLGLELEAEIEVEHRGAGAALELEYEEFGEYEGEIEVGGEVVLEELYLRKTFGPVGVQLGRFYLGLGLLSRAYRPSEYLAAARPEAETTVIPAVWDEMGLQVDAALGPVRLTAQVVNGLDSTGFSSQRWIASGHQRRFELVSASDLAFVLRADLEPAEGVLVGASAYYGNTTRNRPKADLVPECPGGDEDEVAPCGVVQAAVTLVDLHLRLELDPLFVQGVVLWGHLDKTALLSERNARLSNNLDVARTPVASQALLTWLELGVDLGAWLCLPRGHHLEPFVRFDYYDTMFVTADEVFDNPRFARAVYTAGIGWSYGDLVYAKLDVAHRDLGAFEHGALRDETSVRLATGFGF